jgi:hypothetical protein
LLQLHSVCSFIALILTLTCPALTGSELASGLPGQESSGAQGLGDPAALSTFQVADKCKHQFLFPLGKVCFFPLSGCCLSFFLIFSWLFFWFPPVFALIKLLFLFFFHIFPASALYDVKHDVAYSFQLASDKFPAMLNGIPSQYHVNAIHLALVHMDDKNLVKEASQHFIWSLERRFQGPELSSYLPPSPQKLIHYMCEKAPHLLTTDVFKELMIGQ